MISRRDLVGKLAAGTAVVLAGGVAGASIRKGDRRSMPDGLLSEPRAAALDDGDNRPSTAETSAPVDPSTTMVNATSTAPAPWDLIRPLGMGSLVAHGWRVAALTGAVDGSAVVTLRNERGRAHRVHICRNAGKPQGLVYTRRFDLVVMNGGRGDLPTEEGFARAVAELGHVLATNENDPRQAPVIAALLPQAERLRLYDDARLR